MSNKSKGRAVVVCTARRGVFFGYTSETMDTIIGRGHGLLRNARMVVYWSAATKGVLGLAAIGPQDGSRVGARVAELACESITAVIACSEEAVARWEAGPWR